MAGAVYPTQGKTLELRGESALGTGTGTLYNLRFSDLVVPTATKHLVAAPNGGHAHSYDRSQPAIPIDMVRESALSFALNILSRNNDSIPALGRIFRSAGCNLAVTTGATVTNGAPAADAIPFTADYGAVGECVTVELVNSKYFPTLIGAYGAQIGTPMMDLPSIPEVGADIVPTHTITPYTGPVDATDTLEFVLCTRGKHTTAPDLSYIYGGCALAAMGELTIKYGEAPKLACTFHVGQVEDQAHTIEYEGESNTIAERSILPVVDDNFEFGFADNGAAGITRATEHLIEAKFNWGFKCIPIMASGGGSVSGLQGYIQVPDGVPTVTITTLYDRAIMTDLVSTAPGDSPRYMHFIQPFVDSINGANTDMTAWGLFLPKCRIKADAPHQVDFMGDNFIKTVQTYQCSGGDDSDLSSTGLDNEARSAPWYFCITGAA